MKGCRRKRKRSALLETNAWDGSDLDKENPEIIDEIETLTGVGSAMGRSGG